MSNLVSSRIKYVPGINNVPLPSQQAGLDVEGTGVLTYTDLNGIQQVVSVDSATMVAPLPYLVKDIVSVTGTVVVWFKLRADNRP